MGYETEAYGAQGKEAFYKKPNPWGGKITPRGGSGGGGINLGNLLGGLLGGKNVDYAQQDFERQKELMDKMYDMSTPYSTYGTLGSTVVDKEGKKLTQTLSPELQAQYDALLERAQLTGQRVGDLSLDPLSLQNKIYEEQQALLQPQQNQARAAMDEQLMARGMFGSTGGALQRGGLETSIGQQNQQALANALTQSQGILDAERARQASDMSNALTMAGQQNEMMAQGADYGKYQPPRDIVSGLSLTSSNIGAQQATRDYGMKKNIWDMLGWSSGSIGEDNWGSGLFRS
tara:strand:+ start:49 stop:915 length:867 start_codon:yes stop_codon:yes gene_type:complete